jgi:hypothetical protein
MRPRTMFCLLLPATLACSEKEPSPTEVRPEFEATCPSPPRATVTASPTSRTVAPNTTGSTRFFVTNNCTQTIPGSTLTSSRTGAVTSVGTPSPATVPAQAPGTSATVWVTYTVGSPGSGTVVLNALSEADGTTSGFQTLTVGSSSGVPYGLWGNVPTNLPNGTIWTAGSISSKSPSFVLQQLENAQNKTPKMGMWFKLAGGSTTPYTTDGHFDVAKWKQTLDDAHGGTIQPDGTSGYYQQYLEYISDGTFLGFVLLDDLSPPTFNPAVTAAEINSIAAHAKMRFPLLTTAVRERATVLEAKPGHGLYPNLDAAWAQYRSDRGTPTDYRNLEIAAASRLQLGLVMGININNGGTPIGTNVTPAQILSWGSVFLEPGPSDYVCGFFMWEITYPNTTHANFTTLANMAKSHVKAPCKR